MEIQFKGRHEPIFYIKPQGTFLFNNEPYMLKTAITKEKYRAIRLTDCELVDLYVDANTEVHPITVTLEIRFS